MYNFKIAVAWFTGVFISTYQLSSVWLQFKAGVPVGELIKAVVIGQ